MRKFNGFVSTNQFVSFFSEQIEILCITKDSHVIKSLNTLFGNTNGFEFYHLHFKDILLLMDCENDMGAYFEVYIANPCTFVKVILRIDSFEQTW